MKLAQYSTEHSLSKNLTNFPFSDLNKSGTIRKRRIRISALFQHDNI